MFVLLLGGSLVVSLLWLWFYLLTKEIVLFTYFYEPVPENLFIKIIGAEERRAGDFPFRQLNFS